MMIGTGLRRFIYTTHITSSVGWLGAVVVFLALAVIGLTSGDEPTVRGAYLVMGPAAWFVLVPLAHASLLSGVVLSVGTPWGLFRHYWVVVKLAMTVFATIILLVYMGTFRQMAGVAADPVVALDLVRNRSPMVHAILALLLLLTATALAIYKPFGLTAYGMRKQDEHRRAHGESPRLRPTPARADATGTRLWVYVSGTIVIAVVLMLLLILHLMGGSVVHH